MRECVRPSVYIYTNACASLHRKGFYILTGDSVEQKTRDTVDVVGTLTGSDRRAQVSLLQLFKVSLILGIVNRYDEPETGETIAEI